ncbi:MAG: histidine kinase [Lysobacterales bacterium]
MPAPAYALDQPLPAEVVVGGLSRWFSYRRYPVFGKPWLLGRARLYGLIFGLLGLASGLGNGYAAGSGWVGLRVTVLVSGSFLLMGFAGPLLAAWVRRRGWSEAWERRGVVAAVLMGMLAAYAVDQWTSARLSADMPSAQTATVLPPAAAPARNGLHVQLQRGPGPSGLQLLGLGLIYLLVGGGLALRAYFSERQRWRASQVQQAMSSARQAQRDSELRLQILQAQVEPHFLFNSLAAVRSTLRSDPLRAEQTLDALADFLRASIPDLRRVESGAPVTTLGDQVDLCVHYLTVMQLRMGARLRVDIQVSPTLRALPFPPLILLTLVENAIKHGLEPAVAGGSVQIAAERHADWLEVSVRDTGVGLAELPGSGLGLANVRAQLQARYGERATLTVASVPTGGVSAQLRIPIATADA